MKDISEPVRPPVGVIKEIFWCCVKCCIKPYKTPVKSDIQSVAKSADGLANLYCAVSSWKGFLNFDKSVPILEAKELNLCHICCIIKCSIASEPKLNWTIELAGQSTEIGFLRVDVACSALLPHSSWINLQSWRITVLQTSLIGLTILHLRYIK
jgi:hypothetical protein